jgi:choline dehydrogenase
LFTVYPHNDDFNFIQNLTGDASWSADNMRKYFVRAENNQYLPPSTTAHGFDGWFPVSEPTLEVPLSDAKVLAMMYATAETLGSAVVGPITNTTEAMMNLIHSQGDLNRDTTERDAATGMYQTPIHTLNGVRMSPREFVLATIKAGYPLTFQPNTLVSKILLDNRNEDGVPTAKGVEYMRGTALYQAGKI